MNWYKISQHYKTKEGKEITFQAFPFAENNDKRGWICHDIKAYVNGEEAGYIKMTYIPKEKWEEIYHGNIWIFRKLAWGKYDVPNELFHVGDSEIIKHYMEKNYSLDLHPEYEKEYEQQAKYWIEHEKEKAEKEFKLYYLYFVDKPIVDFIRTHDQFQRQRIAYHLHQYANQWLKENFGLKLWLSYCRTDNGKCFYDAKLFELKKYKYQQEMTGGFRRTREYMAENKGWYKKAQQSKSQFSQLDSAYKRGIKAKKEGKQLSDNPYSQPPNGSRSHSPFSSWIRGWMSGSKKI